MIKAPCLFYEIIISREMHNNWCISQSTTKKWLYINTLISFYQFMHDTSMGYPDILRQTPIFCMNTQKASKKERIRKFISSNYRGVFQQHCSTYSNTIFYNCDIWFTSVKKINLSIKPDAPYTSYAPFLSTASDNFKLEIPFFAYIFKSNLHKPIYKPEFVA